MAFTSQDFLDNGTITNIFGATPPSGVNYALGKHSGVDFKVKGGIIKSSTPGEVYKVGRDNAYGNYVVIRDPYNKYHYYAHMANNSIKVKKGDSIISGTILGKQGATGQVTGSHLHYEVRTDPGSIKTAINPIDYLLSPKSNMDAFNNKPASPLREDLAAFDSYYPNHSGLNMDNGTSWFSGIAKMTLIRFVLLLVGVLLLYLAAKSIITGG